MRASPAPTEGPAFQAAGLAGPARYEFEAPLVWVLASKRAGDAGQVLALAEGLGWPFELKHLRFRRSSVVLAPPFASSDAGVDRRRSGRLSPPWPDLVLASGRENEPVARWIKDQSGGSARIVQVGRPWGPIATYDLVVTTPQYRLPARDNVLHNTAPLHRVTPKRLAAASQEWADRLTAMPRPLIAVLVGGHSGPYVLTRRSGERLAAEASALATRLGGSLVVTTSARTPDAAARALERGLDGPHLIYRWRRGDRDNPYFAFLALADEIIVTADSMSMVGEAVATGKRVHLFDLGLGWGSMRGPVAGREQRPPVGEWLSEHHPRAPQYRCQLRVAPSRVTRDLRLVHRKLTATGRAGWLGDPVPAGPPPPLDDLARAVARVRSLMAARGAPVVRRDNRTMEPRLTEAAA